MLKITWLRRTLREIFDIIVGALFVSSMSIGGPLLLGKLHCPTGTFLHGSGTGAFLAQFAPLLLASGGFSALTSSRVRRTMSPYYQRIFLKYYLLVLMCMIPIAAVASFSGFCLQQQTILYRDKPWTSEKTYSWQEITEIDTFCTLGSKGWGGGFVIDLRDGTTINLAGWTTSFIAVYPDIVKALEGHKFAFNSTGVAPGCNVPYLRLLVQPP